MRKDYRIYGYLRLNVKDSSNTKWIRKFYQFIEDNSLEVDEIVEEVIGGNISIYNRFKFIDLVNVLRKYDILIICRRLDVGRSYAEVIEILNQLRSKEVKVCILELPFFDYWHYIEDNRLYNSVYDLMLLYLKELEDLDRQCKSETTKRGMKKVAEAGVKRIGHPVVAVPDRFKKNYKKYKAGVYGGMSLPDFCKMNGISKTCYYNYEKKMKQAGEI